MVIIVAIVRERCTVMRAINRLQVVRVEVSPFLVRLILHNFFS